MIADLLTPRLALFRLVPDSDADADFMLRLLNQRSFIDAIADRGVRTREQAAQYIAAGPFASYREHGFGLMRMSLRACGTDVGVCGLLRRPHLDAPDLGYALIDAHAGCGYAREAAAATLDRGWNTHGLQRIMAIVSPHNSASIRLLTDLGFRQCGEGGTPDDPLLHFDRQRPAA